MILALSKNIRQDDGVTTNYHRIWLLTKNTNCRNSIAVLSYTDETARNEEKENTNVDFQPYRQSITYELAYDESMTIEDAYAYLKTLPEFEGAEDI